MQTEKEKREKFVKTLFEVEFLMNIRFINEMISRAYTETQFITSAFPFLFENGLETNVSSCEQC